MVSIIMCCDYIVSISVVLLSVMLSVVSSIDMLSVVMLSFITLSIITLSIIMLSTIMLSGVMLCANCHNSEWHVFFYCYAKYHYAKCCDYIVSISVALLSVIYAECSVFY
jgi:hypothetical protein